MASTPVKLKLLPRSTLKAKNVTHIVGQVTAGDHIDVVRSNGNFEVSVDPSTLGIDQLQPIDSDLTALANNSTNGLWARTAAGTGSARTITGTANEITATNGDGVSGNPTLSLPSALTFTGKTITGGAYVTPTVTTSITPTSNDGAPLGSTSLQFSDLFLASGGVINFANGDVTITHVSPSELHFSGAPNGYLFDGGVIPSTNDGAPLGALSFQWSDLFLASGAVVNFAGGDVTITHASNTLTFAGASSGYLFDATTAPATNDGAPLGSTSLKWSDLFLASGGVLNWDSGDVTITHSANALSFAGASNGYTFDQPLTFTSTIGALRSKMLVITRDLTAATGSVGYTGVGFRPSALIAMGGSGSTIGVYATYTGLADSLLDENALVGFNGGQTPVSGNLLGFYGASTSDNQLASVASYDSDGFTLSWTKTGSPTGTATIYVLCLR